MRRCDVAKQVSEENRKDTMAIDNSEEALWEEQLNTSNNETYIGHDMNSPLLDR